MKIAEVIAEVWREHGLPECEIRKKELETSRQSLALFGFDVGRKEMDWDESERLRTVLRRFLAGDAAAAWTLRAGHDRFERQHRVDGVIN